MSHSIPAHSGALVRPCFLACCCCVFIFRLCVQHTLSDRQRPRRPAVTSIANLHLPLARDPHRLRRRDLLPHPATQSIASTHTTDRPASGHRPTYLVTSPNPPFSFSSQQVQVNYPTAHTHTHDIGAYRAILPFRLLPNPLVTVRSSDIVIRRALSDLLGTRQGAKSASPG